MCLCSLNAVRGQPWYSLSRCLVCRGIRDLNVFVFAERCLGPTLSQMVSGLRSRSRLHLAFVRVRVRASKSILVRVGVRVH
jgi:hypothetical protein